MQHLFTALILLAGSVGPSAAERRPNMVIILADDMGYGDASCYGNTLFETPRLDRMAREGLRFTDFHASGNVCSLPCFMDEAVP